jgi:predicted transcriptional regulator
MKLASKNYMKPRDEFEKNVDKELKRMGMESSPVRSAPFDIVGKERFSVITSLSRNGFKIKREARVVRSLSDIFSTKGFFVAKKAENKVVSGVPVLLESELTEIESPKELKKVIKEKSE